MAGESEFLKQLLGMAGTGGLSAASAMNPYAAIAGAIPQVFQGVLGVGQMIKGAKLAKSTQRPWMDVPAAQTEALFNARNMANGQAPGLNTAMQQLAQSQAGSIAGIQNSGGGGAERLAALTMLDQNAGTQAQNLGAMQENWRANQMGNLQNQLMQLADTQQKQFMYNKDEPYRNIMAASKASTDSGIQNLHGSLTGLGGTFAASLTKRPAGDIGSLVDSPAPSVAGRQPEPMTDTSSVNKQNQMGPQGEGPMNGLPANSELPTDSGEIPFMGSTNPGDAAYNPDGQPIPGYDYAMGNNFGRRGNIQAPLGKNANPKLYGSVFNNLMRQLNINY